MSVETGNDQHNGSDHQTKKRPKPPLGPPHDTLAMLCITVLFASGLFFIGLNGSFRTTAPAFEPGWMPWTGMALSFGGLLAALHYAHRAYGSDSQSWSRVPLGARISLVAAYILVIQIVGPALYAQYAEESLMVLVLGCLAVATLAIAPFRAALGKAPTPERASASGAS